MAEDRGNSSHNFPSEQNDQPGMSTPRVLAPITIKEYYKTLSEIEFAADDPEKFNFSANPDFFDAIFRSLACKNFCTGDESREIQLYAKLLSKIARRRELCEKTCIIIGPLIRLLRRSIENSHVADHLELLCFGTMIEFAVASQKHMDILRTELTLEQVLQFASRRNRDEARTPLTVLARCYAEYYNDEATITEAFNVLYYILGKRKQHCGTSVDVCATVNHVLTKKPENLGIIAASKILRPLLKHAKLHENEWTDCIDDLLLLIDGISHNILPQSISLMNQEVVQLLGSILSAPDYMHLHAQVCLILIEFFDAGPMVITRTVRQGVLNDLVIVAGGTRDELVFPARRAYYMFLNKSLNSHYHLAIEKGMINSFCQLLCSKRVRILIYGLTIIKTFMIHYFLKPSAESTQKILDTALTTLLQVLIQHEDGFVSKLAHRILYMLPRSPGERPLTPPSDSMEEDSSDSDDVES